MGVAIVLFRRDLRLDDHPALHAALRAGHRIVPAYVHVPEEEAPWSPGAASRAWLRRSLRALDASLRAQGTRLVVRRGPCVEAVQRLAAETGAEAVYWSRRYEPACIAADTASRKALRGGGLHVESHGGALLFEPWTVATQQGEPYRVFTPFWRNARSRVDALEARPAPASTEHWQPLDPALESVPVDAILPAPSPAWDCAFWDAWQPGEQGAQQSLAARLDRLLEGYSAARDAPADDATSRLSPHLHFGEISPRRIVQALRGAAGDRPSSPNAEAFVRELGWREFGCHLLFHFPQTPEANFQPRYDDFDWASADPGLLDAWRHGRTGVPLVDAGMRQLWRTGWMHNRVRMVVASFLCKNLRMHWSHGAQWFWDTLVDADLANNTLGWQWSAGTGADAAPYFRVFNPVSQATRFDPAGVYVRRWVPELAGLPDPMILEPWKHPGEFARLAGDYPRVPIVDLSASRNGALAAYAALRAPASGDRRGEQGGRSH